MTSDPLGAGYGYAANTPTNAYDPSGLMYMLACSLASHHPDCIAGAGYILVDYVAAGARAPDLPTKSIFHIPGGIADPYGSLGGLRGGPGGAGGGVGETKTDGGMHFWEFVHQVDLNLEVAFVGGVGMSAGFIVAGSGVVLATAGTTAACASGIGCFIGAPITIGVGVGLMAAGIAGVVLGMDVWADQFRYHTGFGLDIVQSVNFPKLVFDEVKKAED